MMLNFWFVVILLFALALLLWPVRGNKKLMAIIGLLFFAGSFGVYGLVGTPEIVPMLAGREEKLSALKASIAAQSDILKADPLNLGAWVQLGADFMETQQYDAAAHAFKQTVVITHGNPLFILAYAKATIAADGGKVSDMAKKSFEMVLLQEPQNTDARYWLIVRKLQDGDTQTAMQEMKALYGELPKDSQLRKMIDAQIGRN